MVVVLAPAVEKNCESFTHNPLTRDQGKPTFLSLMGFHKQCIANVSKFESDLWGGRHGCACITMVNQQYALHSHIIFIPPRKPVRSQTYPINPTNGNIIYTDQKFQNNLHKYHLVKNINTPLKKIFVTATDDKCLKGTKDMVMVYANKYFMELRACLYGWYRQITPGDLTSNQDKIQATYNVEEPVEILFNHMKTGQ